MDDKLQGKFVLEQYEAGSLSSLLWSITEGLFVTVTACQGTVLTV